MIKNIFLSPGRITTPLQLPSASRGIGNTIVPASNMEQDNDFLADLAAMYGAVLLLKQQREQHTVINFVKKCNLTKPTVEVLMSRSRSSLNQKYYARKD
jgi:hypothetical protein